jgi:hypothetical protein
MTAAQMASAYRCTVDRDTKETTCYVDIKSEQLRDVLRKVLVDISVVSLKGHKPSVSHPLHRKINR